MTVSPAEKKPAAPRKPRVKRTPAVPAPAEAVVAPDADLTIETSEVQPAPAVETGASGTSEPDADEPKPVESEPEEIVPALAVEDAAPDVSAPVRATTGLSFLRSPITFEPTQPKVISSTVIVAMIIGALIGGLSGASVATIAGNTPQSVVINNPQSVTNVAAAAAKAARSVVTIEVSSADASGSGSGIIISPDGYVLTNVHVLTLDGTVTDPVVKVTSLDGQRYSAKVIGLDTVTDIAVIKIVDGAGFAPIAWADSDKLNAGDTAVSIGAPEGLSGTVTSGIVSALNRGVVLKDPSVVTGDATAGMIWVPAIQTDAAINHGNSGGPLLNRSGELIGVNVAIVGEGAGDTGIGFSIEGNVARRIANQIIDHGSATHGLLGAKVSPAASDPNAANVGALIASVVAGLPAEQAGMKAGDVIIRFNGKPISSSTDLTAQVRAAAAGSDAQVVYIRDGRAVASDVTLGNLGDLNK